MNALAQSAKVSVMPWKQVCQGNCNNTQQPSPRLEFHWEVEVGFPKALSLVYHNPQEREPDLKLTHMLWDVVGIVLISPFLWPGHPLTYFAFIIDWRVVTRKEIFWNLWACNNRNPFYASIHLGNESYLKPSNWLPLFLAFFVSQHSINILAFSACN